MIHSPSHSPALAENSTPETYNRDPRLSPLVGHRTNSEHVRSMARSPQWRSNPLGELQLGRSLSPEMQDLRQRRMMMMSGAAPRRTAQNMQNPAISESLQTGDDNFWNTINRYMDSTSRNDDVNSSPRGNESEPARKIVNLGAMSRVQPGLAREKARKSGESLNDDGSTEDTSDMAGSTSEYSDHIRRLEKTIIDEKVNSREERVLRDKMQQLLARELAAQKEVHARDVRHLENNMDKVLAENRRLSTLIEKLLTRMDGGDQDQVAVLSKLQQIRGQQMNFIEVLQASEHKASPSH